MNARCSSRLWVLVSALVVAFVALALRVPRLDQRPMHGDEANQAVRTGILFETGTYHYDPTDHHGPVLYFATLPFCRATAKTFADTTEWNYRLVPVAFSMLTLFLMAWLGTKKDAGLFNNGGGLFSAVLLTAVSPAMAYYSRFYIQETLLVTFLTGLLVCAVRYVRERTNAPSSYATAGYAAVFGAFAGLALATKETVVLSFAAAAVAAVAACGFRSLLRAWNTRDALIASGAAAFVAVVLFSSFFTYPKGLCDALFSTVSAYLVRATEVSEHQHPWNFYLKILFWFKYGRGPVWSEAGLLIPGLLAVVAAFRRCGGAVDPAETQTKWVRFVAVYTLTLTALYSAIPYKTPWCTLSFLHGYILLAGVGAGVALERLKRFPAPGCTAGYIVFFLLACLLVWRHSAQACRACFTLPADPRNPYVYAHTGTDALNLVSMIDEAARKVAGYDTLIAFAVPTPDTWPLPWYLRKYRQVGYWMRVADIPESVRPTVVIAAADQGDAADARFGQGKRASFFGIRPGVLLNVFMPVQDAGEKRE